MIPSIPAWLDGGGPESELVISSRVRLARNLEGYRFWGRNEPEEREAILERVEQAIESIPTFAGKGEWHRLDRLAPGTRRWLLERHLVSWDHAALKQVEHPRSGAAVWVSAHRSVMVNEEDHLRVQAISSGLDLVQAGRRAGELCRAIGDQIRYAFTPGFGYLSSCPSNVGTGLRASVLVHLPGLVATGEIGKILQGISQIGLTCRGLWGEGSKAEGELYQLSNQTTLGKGEGELTEHLRRVVQEILSHERRAREALRGVPAVSDQITRAWGILRHATLMSAEEMLGLLGKVRLGVWLGVLPAVPMGALNGLLVAGQDATLARIDDPDLEALSLPMRRARIVHRMLDARERA